MSTPTEVVANIPVKWHNGEPIEMMLDRGDAEMVIAALTNAGYLAEAASIPMRLNCPDCGQLHVDEGDFATKPHHTHACQRCGAVWRPAVVDTVGVRFLPGFLNEDPLPALLADIASLGTSIGMGRSASDDAEPDWCAGEGSEPGESGECRVCGVKLHLDSDLWVPQHLPDTDDPVNIPRDTSAVASTSPMVACANCGERFEPIGPGYVRCSECISSGVADG